MHPTLPYRSDLQGLRALAILLVVLGHSGVPAFGGGFIGVDVFFVLSGYLITGLLLREYTDTSRIDIAAFIARRLRRLMPALVVMIAVVFAVAFIDLSAYEASEQTKSLPFAVSWTSNLYFALTTFDYFAEQPTRDLFLHTWSLGVEEQFYLLWPLFVLAALTILRRGDRPLRPGLIITFCSALILSLALELYWMSVNTLWAFYLMPARIWQFALGATAFVLADGVIASIESRRRYASSVYWQVAGIAGLGSILASAILLTSGNRYPGLLALAPSFGAALVIVSGHIAQDTSLTAILGSRPAVWLGDRSYSLYLWHWPVLLLGTVWPRHPDGIGIALLLCLSLLIATASHRWIEQPFWKGRFSRTQPRHAFIGATFVFLTVILGMPQFAELASRQEDSLAISLPGNLRVTVPDVYPRGCDSWTSSADLVPCIGGNPDASQTALLLGDSIGTQWYGLLPEIFDDDWRIIVLTKSSCPIVDEDFFYERIGSIYSVCTQWRNAALAYIADIRPDIVFIGSSADYPFTPSEWVDGSERVIGMLSDSAQQVIVIPGTPALSFNGPACLERATYKSLPPESCWESVGSSRSADVSGYLSQAVNDFENVHLLDLGDLVCPGNVCSAVATNGLAVFRDHQHLSDRYVRSQAGPVKVRLTDLGVRTHAMALLTDD